MRNYAQSVADLTWLKKGLTPKNRDRLRQVNDLVNVAALVGLPQRVATAARAVEPILRVPMRSPCSERPRGRYIAPGAMRIGNLASLDSERNILRTRAKGRGVVHLAIPAEKVKNGIAIEAEFRPRPPRLLDLYLERFRPLLLAQPSSMAFPEWHRRAQKPGRAGIQISKFLGRECGLQVNPHLFRHSPPSSISRPIPAPMECSARLRPHLGRHHHAVPIAGLRPPRRCATSMTTCCGCAVRRLRRPYAAVAARLRMAPE